MSIYSIAETYRDKLIAEVGYNVNFEMYQEPDTFNLKIKLTLEEPGIDRIGCSISISENVEFYKHPECLIEMIMKYIITFREHIQAVEADIMLEREAAHG